MKIKIRYDNKLTEVEIPDDDYTLMLDIDYEMRLAEAPEDKKEEIERCNTVQEMFDLMNKTEYNNWHKFDRHSALTTTPKRIDGKTKKDIENIVMGLFNLIKKNY
jgi:cobalamin biosynthesis protein CbiD